MKPRTFDQHRGIAPMLWVFAALALLELLVVHLFVATRWPWLGWPLTILSGLTILWLVHWIRSFKRMPHELDEERLRLHFGSLRTIEVPLDRIAVIRSHWDGAELKRADVVNLVPVAYPNRMITIDPPIAGRRRPISAVAFRVDDPTVFDAALGAHGVAVH